MPASDDKPADDPTPAPAIREPRPTRENKTLVRLAPFVLAAMLALGGWYIYRSAPVEFVLRFEVSPSFRTADRPIRRESVVDIKVTVLRAVEGKRLETIAKSSRDLGAGLVSPLSPPLHLTLPRGKYTMSIQLLTADGRSVSLMRALNVDKDGEQRIEL